ncbi:hypothetical protein F4778DRAFT_795322 [Xylariomycetidae sp. FL2044]|nr:hypothetical protein F4778DRAFT_795322 [Xylariomycetidae sp. FL2044]
MTPINRRIKDEVTDFVSRCCIEHNNGGSRAFHIVVSHDPRTRAYLLLMLWYSFLRFDRNQKARSIAFIEPNTRSASLVSKDIKDVNPDLEVHIDHVEPLPDSFDGPERSRLILSTAPLFCFSKLRLGNPELPTAATDARGRNLQYVLIINNMSRVSSPWDEVCAFAIRRWYLYMKNKNLNVMIIILGQTLEAMWDELDTVRMEYPHLSRSSRVHVKQGGPYSPGQNPCVAETDRAMRWIRDLNYAHRNKEKAVVVAFVHPEMAEVISQQLPQGEFFPEGDDKHSVVVDQFRPSASVGYLQYHHAPQRRFLSFYVGRGVEDHDPPKRLVGLLVSTLQEAVVWDTRAQKTVTQERDLTAAELESIVRWGSRHDGGNNQLELLHLGPTPPQEPRPEHLAYDPVVMWFLLLGFMEGEPHDTPTVLSWIPSCPKPIASECIRRLLFMGLLREKPPGGSAVSPFVIKRGRPRHAWEIMLESQRHDLDICLLEHSLDEDGPLSKDVQLTLARFCAMLPLDIPDVLMPRYTEHDQARKFALHRQNMLQVKPLSPLNSLLCEGPLWILVLQSDRLAPPGNSEFWAGDFLGSLLINSREVSLRLQRAKEHDVRCRMVGGFIRAREHEFETFRLDVLRQIFWAKIQNLVLLMPRNPNSDPYDVIAYDFLTGVTLDVSWQNSPLEAIGLGSEFATETGSSSSPPDARYAIYTHMTWDGKGIAVIRNLLIIPSMLIYEISERLEPRTIMDVLTSRGKPRLEC